MASNTLDIYVWDVGHGLSVSAITPYVTSASGIPINRERVIQFDAGHHSGTGFSPFQNLLGFGHSEIDCFILSHFDEDHISDLVNGSGMKFRSLWRNRTYPNHLISDNPFEAVTAKKVALSMHSTYVAPVPVHDLFVSDNYGGVVVTTTSLPYEEGKQPNDLSLLATLEFSGLQMIFPGDISASAFDELQRQGKLPAPRFDKYRFLMASHHGRESAEPRSVLEYYQPHLVLASAADGDEHTDSLYSSDLVSGYVVNGNMSPSKFISTKNSKAIKVVVSPLNEPPMVTFHERRAEYNFDAILRRAMEMRMAGLSQ